MTNNDPWRIYTVPNHPAFVFAEERRALQGSETLQMLDDAQKLCPKRAILVKKHDGEWSCLSHGPILRRGNENQAVQAYNARSAACAKKKDPPRRILG